MHLPIALLALAAVPLPAPLALPSRDSVQCRTDASLVVDGLAGDDFALRVLYQRHVRTVTRRVIWMLARRDEAEDVVQDAFALAFQDLPSLKEPARFGSWVARIAVRQVHRRLRRRRLLQRLGLDQGLDDATLERLASPEASAETLLVLRELDHWLATVSTPCRTAWILRWVDGNKLEEIAEQCSCSLATVKRRLARAERTMRDLRLEYQEEEA